MPRNSGRAAVNASPNRTAAGAAGPLPASAGHRIFVLPVKRAHVHPLARPLTETADERRMQEWPAEGAKGVLLLAFLPAELEGLRHKLNAIERRPPQIMAVLPGGREQSTRGTLQLTVQIDWQDEHPRGFWVPEQMIRQLMAEGWPDLRTLKEIPAERVPLVPQQITRRRVEGNWSEPLPLLRLSQVQVHYEQLAQGARLQHIRFASQLDPRRSGWTAMLLEAVAAPEHFRRDEGSSSSTTQGPSGEGYEQLFARLRHGDPRPAAVPGDAFADCKVSAEDAALIEHLAAMHARDERDLVLLRRLSPSLQAAAIRMAIEMALQWLPPDEHLSTYWQHVAGALDAGRSPGAEAATRLVELPSAWPMGQGAPPHWAVNRWAGQMAQGIYDWAHAVGADSFGEHLSTQYRIPIPDMQIRPALLNLMGALERIRVAVALADPVSHPDAPLYENRQPEPGEYERQQQVWPRVTGRFLRCWWAAVERRFALRDVESAEVSGPREEKPVTANPYPEGSDGYLLFNELLTRAQQHPIYRTAASAGYHVAAAKRQHPERKHYSAWQEVIAALVKAGVLEAPPAAPLSVENFDGRYVVPQCPQVIWDSRDGLGAVGNNADIRHFGFLALMRPQTFLRLAAPLPHPSASSFGALDEHREMPGWGPALLYLDMEDPQHVRVLGHEGRHRATRLQKLCPDALLPVAIMPQYMRAKDMTRELLGSLRSGIFSERSTRRTDDSRFVVGPLFDRVFVRREELDLRRPPVVDGPPPQHEDLTRRVLLRLLADWNRGSLTADEVQTRFEQLLRDARPETLGALLAELRPQSVRLADALMQRLPPEVRVGRIEVSPEGSVEVETTQQLPEDDPVLPIVRAFDEATLGHEAMAIARDYLDSLWRAGLSPARLKELIGRLEPMILGPDEWSGTQVAQFLRSSLTRQLKKPYEPGDTVGGPPPEELPSLTEKQREIIAANERTEKGRRFVHEMIRLLNKSPEEARRALLRPSAWTDVLDAARKADAQRRKASAHSDRLKDAVWQEERAIETPPKVALSGMERHAVRQIAGEHRDRTGRSKRASAEVISRTNEEARNAQVVVVRLGSDYYRLLVPFGATDRQGRRFVMVARMVPDVALSEPVPDPEADPRLVDPIIAFLESGRRNLWVTIGPLEIYVRRSTRLYGHAPHRTLDLANFKIDEAQQGKGHFSRFMRAVVADPRLARWTLYVENVIGGREDWQLVDWFQQRHTQWVQSGGWPPSFWMLRPGSQGEDALDARGP